MMGNLLDPDLEYRDLNVDDLRVMASGGGESVLRRGRAMMELGRRASCDAVLLREVAEMIRSPQNRRIKTAGSTSISQLGTAGLVADGSETAVALAAELVGEWRRDEQSDFAWLMRISGITWPPAQTRVGAARVRHGIQLVQVDDINCELRIVGSDDAGTFLWAAQWLDEHRGFVVNAARFEARFHDDFARHTDEIIIFSK